MEGWFVAMFAAVAWELLWALVGCASGIMLLRFLGIKQIREMRKEIADLRRQLEQQQQGTTVNVTVQAEPRRPKTVGDTLFEALFALREPTHDDD